MWGQQPGIGLQDGKSSVHNRVGVSEDTVAGKATVGGCLCRDQEPRGDLDGEYLTRRKVFAMLEKDHLKVLKISFKTFLWQHRGIR